MTPAGVGVALVAGLVLVAPAPAASAEVSPTVGGERLASTGLVVDAPGAAALPEVGAAAYVIADVTTGEVLAAKDPHGAYRPASTLKVLTALTLLPRLDPGTVYTARWEDANAEGSRVGVVPDATYTVDQLFQALLMVSGNDAASALANAAGGQAPTVAAMNATARSLGAHDTTARNPSGLDAPGQYTSAYDLAVLGRAALAREDFRAYTATVKSAFPGKMPKAGRVRKTFEIYTQDRLLLNYRGAIGVKNGWTTKARGTFVGAATRGGRTLVATVLRTEGDSWRDAARLLTWGFQNASLARPVGTLDATPTGRSGKAGRVGPAADGLRSAGAAGEAGGPSWWVVTPLLLVVAVALLRLRVRLRRRRRRLAALRYPVRPPYARQRPDRGRVRTPASPAPRAAPSAMPRTVRILREEPEEPLSTSTGVS